MLNAGRGVLVVVGAVALIAGVGTSAGVGTATGISAVPGSAAVHTDVVQFGADFRPFHVNGQWASTSVHATTDAGVVVTDSLYLSDPPAKRQESYSHTATDTTTACVYTGGAEPSCQQSGDRSSSSTSGRPASMDWDPPGLLFGLLRPNIQVRATSDIATGARCWVDASGNPAAEAVPPGGIVQASSSASASTGSYDVGAIASGTTLSQTYTVEKQLLLNLSTSTAEVEITPTWGQDPVQYTAFSEVKIRYRGTSAGLLGLSAAETAWTEYTVRSECGLRTNDGGGVTGPLATVAPLRATLATPETTAPAPAPTSIVVNEATLVVEYSLTVPEATYPYRVRAERSLSDLELALARDVLTDVALNPATDSGALPGIRWEIHSADGLTQLVPIVAMQLDDGTVVTAEPDLTAATTTEATTTAAPTMAATEPTAVAL